MDQQYSSNEKLNIYSIEKFVQSNLTNIQEEELFDENEIDSIPKCILL